MERGAPGGAVGLAAMRALFAGWGFRATARQQSFASCWAQALAQLAPGGWRFAVLETKLQTPAWEEFMAWSRAAVTNAECRAWPESAIAQIETTSVSPRLVARFATGSVCEALALHAARTHLAGLQPVPQIGLIVRRIVSADRQATLAVAQLALPSQSLDTGVSS